MERSDWTMAPHLLVVVYQEVEFIEVTVDEPVLGEPLKEGHALLVDKAGVAHLLDLRHGVALGHGHQHTVPGRGR